MAILITRRTHRLFLIHSNFLQDTFPKGAILKDITAKAPLIENPVETVDEGEAVRFLCHPPDNEEAEVHWRREDGNPLGYGISEEDGALIIPHAQLSDAGAYICSVEDPDGRQIDSSRAYLTVHASTSARMFSIILTRRLLISTTNIAAFNIILCGYNF